MTFSPALPFSGYAGWGFLKRTEAVQQARLAQDPQLARDAQYFRDKIGTIASAKDLVADRRLLRVALVAHGLEADVGNKAFVQKVLESPTLDPQSLANRLADKQYLKLAAAFGFGDFATPRSQDSAFADRLLAQYRQRQFDAAVGIQNPDYRLALNAEREVAQLAGRSLSADGKWFTVLGNPPLRKVFETALRLPASVGRLDIDRQLDLFKDRAARVFGSSDLAQFSDPAKVEGLVRSFLLLSENGAAGGTASLSRGAGALQILQNGGLFTRI
jgi:hypothetical protein